MNREVAYSRSMPPEHIKQLGQYFTNDCVADFMCAWACNNASRVLDPAVGNSVFLTHALKYCPDGKLCGYEIDGKILDYFGNPVKAHIYNEDYLLNGWDEKYDAIICNPPYNRFQAVSNRSKILDSIERHTGIKYSAYTNLYILFLVKSIYQLSQNGKLAYIIPTEFLNSKYGVPIKKMLIDQRLLRAIINFENNHEMFFNATTTCCIIMLDKTPKDHVGFYNLSSVTELKDLIVGAEDRGAVRIHYGDLNAEQKWRSILKQERRQEYRNLIPIAKCCSVARGIATGANDFFCLSYAEAEEKGIPKKYLTKCICRSADIKKPIFTETDYDQLAKSGKKVFLLDVTQNETGDIGDYIAYGVHMGVDKKYLTSCRTPWYSMEQKQVAPIWASSAYRETIKFIRNLAGTKSLTTFHSIYINKDFTQFTDIIFCYFLTPIGQIILRENRKELGNGLNKFQPNDLNTAQMLDISLLSEEDRIRVSEIYSEMLDSYDASLIDRLNNIFSAYLI